MSIFLFPKPLGRAMVVDTTPVIAQSGELAEQVDPDEPAKL
jgi:hypothetical protein